MSQQDHEDSDLDGRIVAALRRDGRADPRTIAAAIDEPETTVRERVRAMEADGTIRGYTALVDVGRLGYELLVLGLAVPVTALEEVTSRLGRRPEFVTVYETSGEYSVVALAAFPDGVATGAALRELHDDPSIRSIDVQPVRDVIPVRRTRPDGV